MNRPEHTTASLALQVIEGVYTERKEITTTPPMCMIGNDRPLPSVMKLWLSPDSKVSVPSKTSDPHSGEFTTRLENINRSEPDLALFCVRPDYQILVETGDRDEIRITRP